MRASGFACALWVSLPACHFDVGTRPLTGDADAGAGKDPAADRAGDEPNDFGPPKEAAGSDAGADSLPPDSRDSEAGDGATSLSAGGADDAESAAGGAEAIRADIGTGDAPLGAPSALRPAFDPRAYPPRCAEPSDCGESNACRNGWCAGTLCGNGLVDPGELCDDANLVDSDGCEPDCQPTRVLDLQVAQSTVCALLGSGRVRCWGRDADGLLARGADGQDAISPTELPLLDFGSERRVVQLSAGNDHFCALFEDARARCWGNNSAGQLGNGSTENYGDSPGETLAALPDLPLSSVAQISAGAFYTCALLELAPDTRRVTCWGEGRSGKLGTGDVLDQLLPRPEGAVNLGGLSPRRVRAGYAATCVELPSREVLCWGNNAGNGLGGVGNTLLPQPDRHRLQLGTPIDYLTGRFCAFAAPSELFCWGDNDAGKLGTPLLFDEVVRAPVRIELGDERFVAVQRAPDHACGLSDSGRIYCFGEGLAPELGYAGRYDASRHPADNWSELPNGGAVDLGDYDDEPGIDRAVQLFTGPSLTCARMLDESLRCFGSNSLGKLGYGFSSEQAPGNIGDDETPAEAYRAIGRPHVELY